MLGGRRHADAAPGHPRRRRRGPPGGGGGLAAAAVWRGVAAVGARWWRGCAALILHREEPRRPRRRGEVGELPRGSAVAGATTPRRRRLRELRRSCRAPATAARRLPPVRAVAAQARTGARRQRSAPPPRSAAPGAPLAAPPGWRRAHSGARRLSLEASRRSPRLPQLLLQRRHHRRLRRAACGLPSARDALARREVALPRALLGAPRSC